MPDARPILAALDRPPSAGDPGEVVVLAGPDVARYQHGVLGDRIEATRILWLDRHSLRTLRELALPVPFVFEDIAPRVVFSECGVALLMVRDAAVGETSFDRPAVAGRDDDGARLSPVERCPVRGTARRRDGLPRRKKRLTSVIE